MTTIEKELSEAAEYVTGGKLDKMPLNKLYYFMTATRGMADIAEAEIKRRGGNRLPIFQNVANR